MCDATVRFLKEHETRLKALEEGNDAAFDVVTALTERVEKLERKSLRWDGYQQAQEEFNVRLLEIEEPSLFPVADTPEPERSSPTEDEELVWVETGSFPGHPSPTSPITGRQEMIDLINEEDYQDRLTEAEGLLKEWRAVQATGHLRLRTGRFLNQERSGDEHIQRRAAEGEGTLVAGDLDISNPNPSDADVAEPRRECTCDWEEIKTDFVELRPVPGCPIHDPHQPTGSREREAYLELLYEVDTKVPGESRHDTAKRWLRERRERDLNTPEMTDSDAILGESHE